MDGEFLEHCPGLERDAAKSFVNSCLCIGKEGIQRWCREHNFTTLPQALAEYLADIRKATEKDALDHPELVQKLRDLGKEGRDLSMALTYSLNSVYEYETNAAAMERCQGLAVLRCDELDGLFLERMHGHTWQEIENALGDVYVHKPYRTRAELLQILMAKLGLDWLNYIVPSEKTWLKDTQMAFECAKRLVGHDKPVIWVANILPGLLTDSVFFKDRYKTSPSSGQTLDVFKCVQRANGYLWEAS